MSQLRFATRTSINTDVLVLDLVLTDFAEGEFVPTMCALANQHQTLGCIIDVSRIALFLQSDIQQLSMLVNALELCGYRVIVCGFDPLCAALIYTYVDVLPFTTELNSRYALEVLQS